MSDVGDPIDQIAFLARSESRVRVLEHLLEHGATSRRAFREHLDVSRSTVTRTLTDLTDRDWLEETDNTYRLTPSGKVVAE